MSYKDNVSYSLVKLSDSEINESDKTPLAASQDQHISSSAQDSSSILSRSLLDRILDFIEGAWIFELFSWLVSAVLTFSLVILLRRYQDNEVPKWPYRVTLNAVIATMSTLARALLVLPVVQAISQLKWIWFIQKKRLSDLEDFDEASRGAWGSLKLLRLILNGYVLSLRS